MTIGAFVRHLKYNGDLILKHEKRVIWTGSADKLPGRYRHYKVDTFFWDDFAWRYEIKFFREGDVVVREVK